MPKDFTLDVDMLEQTNAWYFTLDSKEQKEYLYKKRTGLLQRKINKHRINKSIELSSLSHAKPLIHNPITPGVLKIRAQDISFNPDKILRDNELVINTLEQLKPVEWKIVVRANHTGRVIIKKGEKEKKTNFTYFSILIKLQLKDHRNFIEVGEGSVQTLKFNQDGLCSRIKKIVENHQYSKSYPFIDKVPVILNAGDGAIIFHELLGHSLEADYIYHRHSPISRDDIGKPIISKNVTLLTRDPNDNFFRGVSCDDEGETAGSSILVENGVLGNLIADRVYKNRLKVENCGHSRVEDFSKIPMPRMYALYLQPGNYHPKELIASTKTGVYASEFGDGKVFFDKNLFYFNIREAWLIKNGKICDPLGSIMVRGNILEVLNSVEMVANDFRFDKGISYCFKNGQTLNVRVGQPTVKINNLYVTKEIND
ncbi:MAG: TldD/PmbA family protein [Candidatus Aminicenantes bacterium]|nr:MAG: TldD/PmbA family protein [Candidatus Aminicenantes bacterium]